MMKSTIAVALIVLLAIFTQGEAAPDRVRDCICPVTANINYVCGSNGVTYVNPSELGCSAKCTRSDIRVEHYGKCKE